MAQDNIAARLDGLIRAAVPAVVSVSIGAAANKATWKVQPESLQAAAQPIIDAFDVNDPAHARAEADAEVDADDRLVDVIEAIVNDWTVISTLVAAGKKPAAAAQVKSSLRRLRRTRKGV